MVGGWAVAGLEPVVERPPPATGPPPTCWKYSPKYSPTNLQKFLQIFHHSPAVNIVQNIPRPTCCKYCPRYSTTHLLQILSPIFIQPPATNIATNIPPPTCCKYCPRYSTTHLLQVVEICQTLFFCKCILHGHLDRAFGVLLGVSIVGLKFKVGLLVLQTKLGCIILWDPLTSRHFLLWHFNPCARFCHWFQE